MSQEMNQGMQGFDFAQTEAATSSSYLTPGVYDLTATKAEHVKGENGKNSYLNVTFTTDGGATMQHRFFITPKAAPRLQYFHEQMFGKKLEKAFPDSDAIGVYFSAAVQKVQPKKRILVKGKQQPNGTVFTDLGYADFVVDPATPTGAFEEGSAQWRSNVKIETNAASNTNAAVLSPASSSNDGVDDLPF